MNPTAEKFVEEELRQVTEALDGPITSFAVERALRTKMSEEAIRTGRVNAADFAKCPAFEDPRDLPGSKAELATALREQKQRRFEAKRAVEIVHILNAAGDKQTREGEVLAEFADSQLWQATLVEGARRTHLALHDPQYAAANDPQRSHEMVQLAIEHLYDKPDPEVVNHCRSKVDTRLQKALQAPPEARDFTEHFARQYGEVLRVRGKEATAMLDEKRAAELHDLLHEKFDEPLARVRTAMNGEISNEQIPQAANLLLQELGFQEVDPQTGETHGWKARADERTQGFRVDEGPQELVCGRRRKEITWETFGQLLPPHEIQHLTRAERGKKSGFAPLGYGLARNVDTEEGLCMVMEMVWRGKQGVELIGRDHYRYLTASYAMGAMDGRMHDPQETFDFISPLIMISKIASKPATFDNEAVLSETQAASRGEAFEHVFRAFRGGILFPKDLAYLGGKIKMINYINRSPLPTAELYDYLASGKFNPLIANQAALAYRLWAA